RRRGRDRAPGRARAAAGAPAVGPRGGDVVVTALDDAVAPRDGAASDPDTRHDDDHAPLGLVGRVLAVPLAPFVALWEGARALVTRLLPAVERRILALLERLVTVLLRPLRAVGRLVAAVVSGLVALLSRPLRAIGR